MVALYNVPNVFGTPSGVEVPKLVHDETSGDTMLHLPNPEMQEIASFPSSSSSTFPLPESREFHLSVSSVAIAPDQLRMIDNINSLISEVAIFPVSSVGL